MLCAQEKPSVGSSLSRELVKDRAGLVHHSNKGFTLLELVVVILIIGIMAGLFAGRMGTFQFWREEGFIRRLSETIEFLHHQAISDSVFYRIEFFMNEDPPRYRVREVIEQNVGPTVAQQGLAAASNDVGFVTTLLQNFLIPKQGNAQMLIEPRSFPSLANPVMLPEGAYFEDVRTMRGKFIGTEDQNPYIAFSPRGFSEFGVIHLRLKNERPITILINPFTGLTELYRSYEDFEWTYGQNQ